MRNSSIPRAVFRCAGLLTAQTAAWRHSLRTSTPGKSVVHLSMWDCVKLHVAGVPLHGKTITAGSAGAAGDCELISCSCSFCICFCFCFCICMCPHCSLLFTVFTGVFTEARL